MNRTQYRQARRLCRQNGRYALRWLPKEQAKVMEAVMYSKPCDLLTERADCYETMGWGIHLAKSLARDGGAQRFARKAYSTAQALAEFQGGAA
jgi:hypothetical protein